MSNLETNPKDEDLSNLQPNRVLFYHKTDHWYFGDFLRYSAWLSALYKLHPKSLEIATHKDYLPLFDDSRVNKLHDISTFTDDTLSEYDLVVIPSDFKPEIYATNIKRAVHVYESGWAYAVDGVEVRSGTKDQLNYFMAARDNGGMGLPEVDIFKAQFSDTERDTVDESLARIFKNDLPIIVYNPSASNSFTRETNAKKAVDNSLSIDEHEAIAKILLEKLPGYNFLVASSVKSGDEVNIARMKDLASRLGTTNVKSIFDLNLESATTLRGFTSILDNHRVEGIIGVSTGTNAHLASIVNLPSLSIERAVDDEMIGNWHNPSQFQMGSFRWRNPADDVLIFNMNWQDKSRRSFEDIAQAFAIHLKVSGGDEERLFTGVDASDYVGCASDILQSLEQGDIRELSRGIQDMLGYIRDDYRYIYSDFHDEFKYLEFKDSLFSGVGNFSELDGTSDGLLERNSGLICNLFEYSNLYKLCKKCFSQSPEDGGNRG